MKIVSHENLYMFDFWCGAEDTAHVLTQAEMEMIDDILSEIYPEGLSPTEINDIFWFDSDWIAELVGYNDFEELWKDRWAKI